MELSDEREERPQTDHRLRVRSQLFGSRPLPGTIERHCVEEENEKEGEKESERERESVCVTLNWIQSFGNSVVNCKYCRRIEQWGMSGTVWSSKIVKRTCCCRRARRKSYVYCTGTRNVVRAWIVLGGVGDGGECRRKIKIPIPSPTPPHVSRAILRNEKAPFAHTQTYNGCGGIRCMYVYGIHCMYVRI